MFGSACSPGHSRADAVDAGNDMMLSQGCAVAASSVNVFGNVCNFHVAADSVMMLQERLIEGYGELRYTIGNGCSGGSEAQNSIAENYPDLLQGILPHSTFADAWTPSIYDKFEEQTYDPETNPAGARCTLQDYNASVLGRRPSDGFGNGINDHVGRQWGVAALQAGKITTQQFADLNEKLGGFMLDFEWKPEHTKGDVAGIERCTAAVS